MGDVIKKPRLILIDMFNITIGMNATKNILNKNTEQVGMYLGTIDQIKRFAEVLSADKIFCCYDGPEAGARRRSIYKEYKDKRRVKSRISVVKLYEDENEVTEYYQKGAFEQQLAKVYETSKYLPIQNFIIKGCEADDVIAYSALKYKDEYDVYIVSRDKDYLQLVSEGIKVYNPTKKKIYNQKNFKEEFGIIPENYIFMKILLGDVSDKIDGLKGIGKKTVELLHPFLNERVYADVTDFLEYFRKLELYQFDTRARNALTKMLSEDMIKKMLLSYQLMKLDMNCLKLHHIGMYEQQLAEQDDRTLNRIKILSILEKDEFYKLNNGHGFNSLTWITPFLRVNKFKKDNK